MIKFISIDKALGTGSGKLGYSTLSDYIDNNSERFSQTNGTDKDAIIFFKLQKTIWAKGTFYTCTPAIEQVISGYSTTNVSGALDNTDTILLALEKLEVKVDSKTSNTGTVTGVKMNGSTNNPTNGVVDLGTVITAHQDISGKADKSAAIGSLSLSMDTDYKITLSGKYVNGTDFTVSEVIDLPLESVVVSGSYNSTTKEVTLTLLNGSTVDFSVADLISGLQSEITSSNKLSSDLVDDTNNSHKFVTASDITTWNGKQNALVFNSTYNATTNKVATMNDIPSTLPASGGNADTVSGHSVNSDVPVNAKFTDTTYKLTVNGTTNGDVTNGINLGTVYNSSIKIKAYNDSPNPTLIDALSTTTNASSGANLLILGTGGIKAVASSGTITISLDWEELS